MGRHTSIPFVTALYAECAAVVAPASRTGGTMFGTLGTAFPKPLRI